MAGPTITRAKVIPAEETGLGSARSWQLPPMGAAGAPVASVAELEALRQAAYREGFDQGRKEGRQAGHAEGLAAGRSHGEQEGRESARRMAALLDSLAEPAAELDEAVEQELAALTLMLAQQVIRRELQSQPGEIVPVIREAVALLPFSARDVRVRVHPDDARFLREVLGEDDESRSWRLVEDPGVSRGGCLVATQSSHIDATLEHRLTVLATDWLGDDRRPAGHEEES